MLTLFCVNPFPLGLGLRGLHQEAQSHSDEDYGFVGEVDKVDPHIITKLQQENCIPVIAPIGVDRKGKPYNINADSGCRSSGRGLES